jgi:hypothetical protein
MAPSRELDFTLFSCWILQLRFKIAMPGVFLPRRNVMTAQPAIMILATNQMELV